MKFATLLGNLHIFVDIYPVSKKVISTLCRNIVNFFIVLN